MKSFAHAIETWAERGRRGEVWPEKLLRFTEGSRQARLERRGNVGAGRRRHDGAAESLDEARAAAEGVAGGALRRRPRSLSPAILFGGCDLFGVSCCAHSCRLWSRRKHFLCISSIFVFGSRLTLFTL